MELSEVIRMKDKEILWVKELETLKKPVRELNGAELSYTTSLISYFEKKIADSSLVWFPRCLDRKIEHRIETMNITVPNDIQGELVQELKLPLHCLRSFATDRDHLFVSDYLRPLHIFRKSDWNLVVCSPEDTNFDEIAVDNDNVYTAHQFHAQVRIFRRSDLKLISSFGSYGNSPGQFKGSRQICLDDKHIFVCDTENHRIQMFRKSDHTFVRQFGSHGNGLGQLRKPWNIAVDGEDVFIVDKFNHRIQVFNKSDGKFIQSYYGFSYPSSVAIIGDQLFISSKRKVHVINRFDASFVRSFGEFDEIASLRLHYDGTNLYVMDLHSIKIFC